MESIVQFQNPWGALAFLLIVPLVVLYLLRQRHQELIVPSILLWQEVLAQWQASHPWQRWRRNLLFFLQLLAVCLLALALMRPVWRSSGAGENHIIILDLSMSMQAQEGGRSRLDRAKDDVRALLDGMQRQEEVTLIASSWRNELLLTKSQDKVSALRVLEGVEAGNGGSELEEALQLADSLLDADNNESIHVFTDRDLPTARDHVAVHNIALGADNTALLSAQYSRSNLDDSLRILGLLHNFGRARTVQVELWGDGALLDVQACVLEADSSGNVLFEGVSPLVQHVMLAISESDALSADNQAFLVIQDDERYRVLLQTERNIFLEKSILLRDDIELYKTNPSDQLPEERYALLIVDGWTGGVLPEGQNLWVIAPEDDAGWFSLGDEVSGAVRVANTARNRELLRYVDLSGLQVATARGLMAGDADTSVLAYMGEEPLMILQDRDAVKQLAFGFDLHESNLPLQKDFPILVQNILEWFLPTRQGQTGVAAAGNTVTIALQSDAVSYNVRLPDGSDRRGRDQPRFEETQQLGFYTVTQYDAQGDELARSGFAVNPASAEESELRTAGSEEGQSAVRSAEIWRRQSLWPYLILVALALMALEWWVYHRGS